MQTITDKIEAALNTVRPYLEADGGNVRVVSVSEDKVVTLELVGNCGNCPMSTMTFKAGLEEAILKAVPEVTRVEALNLTPIG